MESSDTYMGLTLLFLLALVSLPALTGGARTKQSTKHQTRSGKQTQEGKE